MSSEREYFRRETARRVRAGDIVWTDYSRWRRPPSAPIQCRVRAVRQGALSATGVALKVAPLEALPKLLAEEFGPDEEFDAGWFCGAGSAGLGQEG